MKQLFYCLLLSSIGLHRSAQAQADAYGSSICLVPPVPELSSGGGILGIVKAIQQRIKYPPKALQDDTEGRVFVRFAVAANGKVNQVDILKGLRPDCDSAVVRAVWQLPRFKPICPDWMPAYFTIPVTFTIKRDLPARKTTPRRGVVRWHKLGR